MDFVCNDETVLWLSERLSGTGGSIVTGAGLISGNLSSTKMDEWDKLPQGHTSGEAHVTL